MKIGERIFEERYRRGMSLRKFALLVGSDYNSLWRYESGMGKPSKLKERMIADKLDILEKEVL